MHQEIKIALDRWRQLWQAVCSQASAESMETAGMYKHGFHFWLVAQSLVSKEEAVDVVTSMEVSCDDAFLKLKVLFQNDNDQDQE